uniref:Genome sequencing data, contig C317 n=1 Tax=Microcystis aeruginosa (strain PCC 7806) TaxID=267872 RepID=A8YIA5_MICA7|nr:unnamed protein product [Microcystis aeruginosa PCC 7806]
MAFSRSSGILLHPTSHPGRYGIGELGREAYQFIDFWLKVVKNLANSPFRPHRVR